MGNVWFWKVCVLNVLQFIFKCESMLCSGRPNDQRPAWAPPPPPPSPLNSPRQVCCHGERMPFCVVAIATLYHSFPSCPHPRVLARSLVRLLQANVWGKEKNVFSCDEGRRALGDYLLSTEVFLVQSQPTTRNTRREENMKGFLALTWHVVKCMGTKLETMLFVAVERVSDSAADFLPLIVEERHCLSAWVSWNNCALLLQPWIVVCRRDCVPAHTSTVRVARMYLSCSTLFLFFSFFFCLKQPSARISN